jgi:aspartate aminotransferase-like enzyme
MLMTPGPTALPPSVREAESRELINPDVDPAFDDLYEAVCRKLGRVYGAPERDVVVLGGEGILGLEAAVASLVEPGEPVLCVANGLYGEGFAEFVASHGGEPTVVDAPHDEPLPVRAAREALATDDYRIVTAVHCETPTGVHNDLGPLLDACDDHGALSVVDAVSSLGGTPVPTDRIDVALGASQKCLSAPPGLTTAALSERAWAAVEARDPEGLYTSLLPWRETDGGYPYTHLSTLVAALDAALDLVLSEGVDAVFERHRRAARRCRERGAEIGLEPYAPALAAPTVTAFEVADAERLQRSLHEDHDVTLATGLGPHADDVLRVGHMGYNADVERVDRAMDALAAAL